MWKNLPHFLWHERSIWFCKAAVLTCVCILYSLCNIITIYQYTLTLNLLKKLSRKYICRFILIYLPLPKRQPQGDLPREVGQHVNSRICRNLTWLRQWGRDKMAAIFQKTLSNAFSWIKMFLFRLKFHWILFLRVQSTIFQHLFR